MLAELFIALSGLAERLPPWYIPVDVLLLPLFIGANIWFEVRRRRKRGW